VTRKQAWYAHQTRDDDQDAEIEPNGRKIAKIDCGLSGSTGRVHVCNAGDHRMPHADPLLAPSRAFVSSVN
jgi:hypothetical protein